METVFATVDGMTASALVGLAAAAWALMLRPSARGTVDSAADTSRKKELRREFAIYQLTEPWIDWLGDLHARKNSPRLLDLQRNLDLIWPGKWRAAEYQAYAQIEGGLVAVAAAMIGLLMGGMPAALFFFAMTLAIYPGMKTQSVMKEAEKRKAAVRSRLPYILDLMALMMEAGALFNECLQTAVSENSEHASGEELGRLQASIRQGIPRATALKEFGARLADQDVNEVVFAVNSSEELGTSLEKTLRNMAERMRQRKIQELEKSAEKAKVHITWPAMLVMAACLLVAAAPMVLSGFLGEQ